jgi:hypothetical protein
MTPSKSEKNAASAAKRKATIRLQTAKRCAGLYPLIANPANLSSEFIQEILIAAYLADIETLDLKVKALETLGASLFDLTWNTHPYLEFQTVTGDPPTEVSDICQLMLKHREDDSLVYLAKKARNESASTYSKIVKRCVWFLTTGINGRAYSRYCFNLLTAISMPQNEKQAIDQLADPNLGRYHVQIQQILRDTAETFLAAHCAQELSAHIVQSSQDDSQPSPQPSSQPQPSSTIRL